MTNTSKLRQAYQKWLLSLNLKYFLTVQFPSNLHTHSITTSQENLRLIMKNFQRQLLGDRWNKKHQPFFAFAEKGNYETYHFHILFYGCDFSFEEIQQALDKTSKNMGLPKSTFFLMTIDENPENLCKYVTKEIQKDEAGNLDYSKLLFSYDIFNLPAPQQPLSRHKPSINSPLQGHLANASQIKSTSPELVYEDIKKSFLKWIQERFDDFIKMIIKGNFLF